MNGEFFKGRRRWMVVGVLAIICLKLWLIAGDEIIAIAGGHDDLLYVQMADAWYWGQEYNALAVTRPPVFPLTVALVALTGVPFRLALELLQILSYLALAAAAGHLTRSAAAFWLTLLLMAFNPLAFSTDIRMTPDGLYGALLATAVAAMFMLLGAARLRWVAWWSIVVGSFLVLLWFTRAETSVIEFYLVGLVAIFAVLQRARGRTWAAIVRGVVVVASIPTLMILVATVVVSALNYHAFGLFATSDLGLTGLVAASRSLSRIETGERMRYVRITREMRRHAYAASPTMASLAPLLEGEWGERWTGYAPATHRVPGEISNGWFGWAFRDAAALNDHFATPDEANEFFMRIHEELEAGFDGGSLTARQSPSAGPPLLERLSRYLGSFRRLVDKVRCIHPLFPGRSPEIGAPLWVRELFDRLTHRRAALARPYQLTVAGWVYNARDTMSSVSARDRNGRLPQIAALLPRPAVKEFLERQGLEQVPIESGFTLSVERPVTEREPIWLLFRTQGGDDLSLEVSPASKAPFGSNRDPWYYHVDAVRYEPQRRPLSLLGQHIVWWIYAKVFTTLLLVSVAGAVVVGTLCRKAREHLTELAMIALLLVVVGVRLVGLSIVDATAAPAADARYVFPVAGLASVMLAHWCTLAVGLLGSPRVEEIPPERD